MPIFSKKFLTVSFGLGAFVKSTKLLFFLESSLRTVIAFSCNLIPL
tara:strand:- start:410 stop:547 length:138 start_codon:yes stop_codon:yes gene_type:complete